MAGEGGVRKFGLAAILTFVDKATGPMKRVGEMAERLQTRFSALGKNAVATVSGLGSLAKMAMPITRGFVGMMKSGVDFEQAFAKVRAVNLDMTGKETASLRTLAKVLGATTVFSATEAANAMEELSRAGFTNKQVMASTAGVLAAAGAEGISLAKASGIVVSAVNMFGVSAERAGEVAGILALTSARTASGMVDLSEALRYVGPAAANMKYTLKDTALALGLLSNIGLKGSVAGTALRGALQRLTKPTKEVLTAMGGWEGINKVMRDSTGKMRPLNEAMLLLSKKIFGVEDAGKRAKLATEIFGARAGAVGQAFHLTGKKLEEFRKVQKEIANESRTAAEKMMLLMTSTTTGQVKALTNSVKALGIEIFEAISPITQGPAQSAVRVLQDLSLAMMKTGKDSAELKNLPPEMQKRFARLSPTVLAVATGIRQGLADIVTSVKDGVTWVGKLGEKFGFISGGKTPQELARTVTKVLAIGVAAGPAAIMVGGLVGVLSKVGSVGLSAARTASGAFSGLMSIVGGILSRLAPELKLLGNLPGKLGKGVESLTAMPVRVVNWPAGGLGGGVGDAAKKLIPGAAGVAGTIGAAALVGMVVGALDAREKKQQMNKAAVAGGTAATLAGAAAQRAGVDVSKVAGARMSAGDLALIQAANVRSIKDLGTVTPATVAMAGMALLPVLKNLLPQMATAGSAKVSPLPAESPARDAMVLSAGLLGVSAGDVVLDRAKLATALTTQTRGGFVDNAVGSAASSGGGSRRTELSLTIPLTIDGQKIAEATGRYQLDQLTRGGVDLSPEQRSRLRRGFLPGVE